MNNKELHNLALKYGSLSLKYRRLFIGLIPEINRRKLYNKHGMHSIFEYAAKIAGVSNLTVEKVLRISSKLKDKPHLREKFEKGEIGWAKMEIIAHIATPEDEAIWAEKAKQMSCNALRVHIHDTNLVSALSDVGETIKLELSTENAAKFRALKKDLGRKLTWNQTIEAILKRIEIKPKRGARNLKKNLGNICVYPQCNKPADVYHHPERYAYAKTHNNVKPLCQAHHEIAHAGLIINEKQQPSHWKQRSIPRPNSIDLLYQHYRAL